MTQETAWKCLAFGGRYGYCVFRADEAELQPGDTDSHPLDGFIGLRQSRERTGHGQEHGEKIGLRGRFAPNIH